jgi:hypothetical protein
MINTFESPIIIEINDDVQTGLKRKAEYKTLIDNRIYKQLSTTWLVKYYQNVNGTYGEEITSEGISSYSRNLIADNFTLVDASQQGAYVAKWDSEKWINIQTGQEYTQSEIDANPYLYGEYDWFMYIAETQSIIINDLIRNAGNLAAAANRF